MENFVIDRCHRLGPYKPNMTRRLICCFNWYGDIQSILHQRKLLPKGVYISEDLPDEWIDCRKVLKPIFNAAKRMETLKTKTHLFKDKLIIDWKTYSAGPDANFSEVNALLDISSTCQRSNENKTIFLGMHSVFSNLHPAHFSLDNIEYNCVEQMLQSEKASLFDDDISHARIMREQNPYKIKKLGSCIKNFSNECWKHSERQIAHAAALGKFQQNPTLRNILLSTGTAKIAESLTDAHWGTGIHLHDKHALDERYWKGDGLMCEIYQKV